MIYCSRIRLVALNKLEWCASGINSGPTSFSHIHKWLTKLIQFFFKFNLYAVYSTLSVSIPSNLSVEVKNQFRDFINAELCNVSNWLNANKIMVNTSKTNYNFFL